MQGIYVVNADGTGYMCLVNNPGNDEEPFWSPNNRGITYRGQGENSLDIFIVSYPNGELTRITNDDNVDGWPCYSPDGRYIAYSKHTNNWDLWIIDLEGPSLEQTSLGRIKFMYR